MPTLSVVIPALNEAENVPHVIACIPRDELSHAGWETEIIFVDNGSTDGTGDIAAALGAKVCVEPRRGYGNAYAAGFAAASGDVIATGDADCTYPFDALPQLLDLLVLRGLDFLSTDRLSRANRDAMKPSHVAGNHLLTLASRALFPASPFRDSQSGMWIFRREIWQDLDVRSPGMPFSQEIKNEAFLKGFICDETAIEYRPRGGVVKLHAARDGLRNASQLVAHRLRGRRVRTRAAVQAAVLFTENTVLERAAMVLPLDGSPHPRPTSASNPGLRGADGRSSRNWVVSPRTAPDDVDAIVQEHAS